MILQPVDDLSRNTVCGQGTRLREGDHYPGILRHALQTTVLVGEDRHAVLEGEPVTYSQPGQGCRLRRPVGNIDYPAADRVYPHQDHHGGGCPRDHRFVGFRRLER